nr:MAG TPA: antitermination protein Q [Bacteriophage sp.]
MARIKWVQIALREWAAWVDSFGAVKGVDYSAVRGGGAAGNWIPTDTRSQRRTHKAVCRIPAEHFATIRLVYLEGPRVNKTSIAEIAAWQGLNRTTLFMRVCAAETRFAEELDSLSENDDAMD